jgi:chromosome segregation ATPase
LPEQATVCPTCGQPIPDKQIDAANIRAANSYNEGKQKAQETFNLDKSNRLEKLTTTGKETRAAMTKKQEEKAKLEGELAELKQKGITAKAALDGIRKQIETAQKGIVDLNTLPEYKLKCAEQAQVQQAITELRNNSANRINEIQAALGDIAIQITKLQASINSVNDAERFKARVEELKADEKRLAKEYENLEKELYTIEEFIRTKVKMLDEKINARFKYVRFKLFNTQINGAIEECCEALINTTAAGLRIPMQMRPAKSTAVWILSARCLSFTISMLRS